MPQPISLELLPLHHLSNFRNQKYKEKDPVGPDLQEQQKEQVWWETTSAHREQNVLGGPESNVRTRKMVFRVVRSCHLDPGPVPQSLGHPDQAMPVGIPVTHTHGP